MVKIILAFYQATVGSSYECFTSTVWQYHESRAEDDNEINERISELNLTIKAEFSFRGFYSLLMTMWSLVRKLYLDPGRFIAFIFLMSSFERDVLSHTLQLTPHVAIHGENFMIEGL